MKKLKKLLNTPGPFFRDYLIKKYPSVGNEQNVIESHETVLINNDAKLLDFDLVGLKNIPVDIVYTWVDNKDEKWSKKYNAYREEYCENIALYGSDSARFSNHDELFYSIYSVNKFLPWVRNIYVITDGQIPTWYPNNFSQKIFFIDHREIIDHEFLPTFNSHVIEAHLHKIPNLSENFLYFNDDVFVARELKSEHFFRRNGIASIFVADKNLMAMHKRGVLTPTLSASLNCKALIEKSHGVIINNPLVHTYIPLKKSMYEKVWKNYEQEIKSFLPNRFRSNDDLNLASFLVPWLMYLESVSVVSRDICYYFNIRSANAQMQYSKLLQKKQLGQQPHSFCANDFHSQDSGSDYERLLKQMLKKYYQL